MMVSSRRNTSEERESFLLVKEEYTKKDVEDVSPEDHEKQGIQTSSWIRKNNNSVTRIIIIFIMLILSFSLGYVSNSRDVLMRRKKSNDEETHVTIQEVETADPLDSSVHDSDDDGIIVGHNDVQQEAIDEQIDMSPNEVQSQDDDKKLINGSSQSQEYPSNVILIHYHKTGNDYLNNLRAKLANQLKGFFHFPSYPFNKHGIKRSHLQSTKCPDNLNRLLGNGTRSDVMKITAPDLYCNEDDLERYMKGIDRVVHMVRDPIDMSISNYLYHSQYPTPESWVYNMANPCDYDQDMFNSVLPRAGIEMEEMNSIITMCKSYFYGNETHPGYPKKSFYNLLRHLPKYDGLRLATAYLFLAKGDLLRMPSNFVRYEQWAQKEDTSVHYRSDRHILNIFMQELQQSMKNTTLKITNFIMADRVKDEGTKLKLSNSIASKLESIYTRKETKGSNHVTNQILSKEQRMNFANRLEDDEVFGSVYSKIRSMMQENI